MALSAPFSKSTEANLGALSHVARHRNITDPPSRLSFQICYWRNYTEIMICLKSKLSVDLPRYVVAVITCMLRAVADIAHLSTPSSGGNRYLCHLCHPWTPIYLYMPTFQRVALHSQIPQRVSRLLHTLMHWPLRHCWEVQTR